jgi:hypothetical protein
MSNIQVKIQLRLRLHKIRVIFPEILRIRFKKVTILIQLKC